MGTASGLNFKSPGQPSRPRGIRASGGGLSRSESQDAK
ncbi:MAG: hypothetical protein OJF48_001235 [Afipia sp.]|nr:MAG: hypothetical protein OJF48_001235 [Afipia sp.]